MGRYYARPYGAGRLVPYFADILGAVLPCLSHGEPKAGAYTRPLFSST